MIETTRRLAPIVLAALALAALAGCGEEAPPPAPPPRPVRTHTVTPNAAEQVVTFAGVARAGVESRLSFRVPGTVERVAVALGDRVRRGRLLARLDAADFELRVQEAEAGRAQAQAALRQAQADYERVRLLYESNNAAKSELDAGRAAAESARARLEASAKQLELARAQLGYTVLRAPLDGAIAAVDVEVNESVAAGETAFLLTAGERPEVEVAVPEVLIAQVREGQPVTAVFAALPTRSLPATVSEVGVAAVGSATTFPVKARLDRPETGVRPGMAADVTFRFPAPGGGRLAVPPVAVGEDRQGRFVFVLENGGDGTATVRRRSVTVGELGTGGLELRAGIEAGETVVTAGVRRLEDGQTVRVLAPENEG